MVTTYQTDFEVNIVGGYALNGILHHVGGRIIAIELDDGTIIQGDRTCHMVAADGAPATHRAIYMLLAERLIDIYGYSLDRLEFEEPDRAADHADRENKRAREWS